MSGYNTRKWNHLHNVRIIGVARITSLSVQESADQEPTSRDYTKTTPAITPTTTAAMEPPTPLPMLLPLAPFPLKELAEVEEEAEEPLEERLEPEPDEEGVTVTPNALVDVLLRAGVVTEPDETEDEVAVEVGVELVVVTVAPIEKSPLVPATALILLISTASIV